AGFQVCPLFAVTGASPVARKSHWPGAAEIGIFQKIGRGSQQPVARLGSTAHARGEYGAANEYQSVRGLFLMAQLVYARIRDQIACRIRTIVRIVSLKRAQLSIRHPDLLYGSLSSGNEWRRCPAARVRP